MRSSFARLYGRAQREVPLRADLPPSLLLSMICALPKDPGTGLTIGACLRVVLAGLRR